MMKSIVAMGERVSEHQLLLLLFGQDSPETGTSPKIAVGSGYTGRRDVVLWMSDEVPSWRGRFVPFICAQEERHTGDVAALAGWIRVKF